MGKYYNLFAKLRNSLLVGCILLSQSCSFTKENSLFASLLFLRGLSNSPTAYTIGGTTSGLASNTITLTENNKGESLAVNASSFAFAAEYQKGDSYSVSITTQPFDSSLNCSLTGGEGTVESGDVNTIVIDCVPQEYTISGTVSGLASTLYLQNGSEVITINANGSFSFPTTFQHGTSYSVTALDSTSIPAQTCIVTNASGSINHGDVSDIVVSCSTNNYLISGTISGLAGSGLVLQNNSGDNLTVSANGSFAFPTSVTSGQTFSVSVATQPMTPAQTCDVFGGSGTVGAANVTSITINCATNKYVVSGSIAGLASSVQLQNNGGDTINVSSNGTFAFPTTLDDLSAYNVTVSSSPTNPWQTCSVSNASGSIASADISNVSLTCSNNTYTLGGSIAGLGAGTVTLRDTISGQTVSASSGASSFNFVSPISSGTNYSIVVDTQPSSPTQTCTVSGGNGVIAGGNVTGITVNCSNNYTVSVALSGLDGTGLQLQNNGGDTITVPNGSASYTFPTAVVDGSSYNASVLAQPTSFSQTCSVTSGSGTISSTNVIVNVSCSYNPFNITVGSITGLTGSGLVLQNNSGDDLSVASSDTSKTFATQVNSKSNYSVSILTQPSSQRCSLSASTGQVVDSDVTGVSLSCVTAYTIGGSVSGLSGTVTITNNGSESLAIAADGGFAFPTSLINGETYSATVTGQPTGSPNQTCSITNASGTVATSNITNIAVTCVTDSVPDPTISALTGITNDVSLTANGPTPAAGSQTLCYSTDGSNPSCDGTTGNCSAGTAYSSAFSLNTATTVKAISCSSGYAGSNVVTSNLTFSGTVGTPVFSPTLGTYNNDQSVTITATNATAIYYTTDGSTPACSGTGTLYIGATTVSADNTMLKAIACANLYSNSAVATTFYNLQVATPTFSLAAGALDAGTGITLASTTTSSWICYSDSSTPACGTTANTCSTGTAGTSYTYAGSSTATLQAIGCKSNYLASNVASSAYTANTYAVGGSISWNVTPNSGTTDLVLSDGTNSLNVTAGSTSFTFPALASGTAYNVAVTTNPTSQGFTCTASSNTGTITTTNVTSVSIACVINRYHISGTISNLGATAGLTVNVINTSDESSLESVSVTGSSTNWTTTGTGIVDSTTYGVQITSQPEGKTCTIVTAGSPSGTLIADISNININCVAGTIVGDSLRTYPAAALKIPTYRGKKTSFIANGFGLVDGDSSTAQVKYPIDLIMVNDTLYWGSNGNDCIRMMDSTGTVTTIAGTGSAGFADGNGTTASFNNPSSITTNGTYLFVTESNGRRVRRITIGSPWTVTTIAGDTSVIEPTGANVDGIGTAARFNYPRGLTTDGQNLYIADNNNIKKLSLADYKVTTIASVPSTKELIYLNGYLYTNKLGGHEIHRISTADYSTSVIVGDGNAGTSDGIGTATRMSDWVETIATDGYNLFFVDRNNKLLRRIKIQSTNSAVVNSVYTVVGGQQTGGADGVGYRAGLEDYLGVTFAAKNIYISNGSKIEKVEEDGLVGFWALTSFPNATTQPTTLYDYSTDTGSDLTNNGATMTSGIYGETNGALEFNGSAYLQGSDTNLPSGNATRSVCAWVYPTVLGTINNVFVGYGTNTSHNSFNLGMRAVTGGAIVTIGVTNSLTSSNLTID
ncbi:MAG: FN3 associated domain-containing protein, partial [Spirochaetota bacterium]